MNNGGYWAKVLQRRLTRRRALAASGTATLGVAALAACGGDDDGEGDKGGLVSQAVDTTKQAKRGGIIKDRGTGDPPTLDLFTANNPLASVADSVYSALVQFKPGYLKPSQNELAPDLAESWETSPDGLQITLKLRQGVKWQNKPPVNGRTLDMDDVLFSWNRFSSKHGGRSGVANSVNPAAPVLSLTATDAKTVVIKLKEPIVYALGLFASHLPGNTVIMPKETDTTFDIRSDMIGTGPFQMTNYTPSVSFTLKRHPEAWDKDAALAAQVDIPIIPEYAAALAQLKAGNIYTFQNFQSSSRSINAEDILPVKREEPRILVYKGDLKNAALGSVTSVMSFGWLPAGKSPFLDERVRQAISMSRDRDLFIDTFLNVSRFAAEGLPVETRWNTAVSATNEGWWLDPQGKDFGPNAKYFKHDLAEAKKLLAAAGYPNGFETTSNYVTGPELGALPKVAEVLDGMARELGLTVKVKALDYLKEYIPQYRDANGQYEGWGYMFGGGAVGGSAVGALANEFWAKGANVRFRGFSTSGKNDQSGDPQVDTLIEKARVEQDTEKRRALVFDLQRYLAKIMYALTEPGVGSGFTVAWPCLGNFNVYSGETSRANYFLWVDETKPPFTSS